MTNGWKIHKNTSTENQIRLAVYMAELDVEKGGTGSLCKVVRTNALNYPRNHRGAKSPRRINFLSLGQRQFRQELLLKFNTKHVSYKFLLQPLIHRKSRVWKWPLPLTSPYYTTTPTEENTVILTFFQSCRLQRRDEMLITPGIVSLHSHLLIPGIDSALCP